MLILRADNDGGGGILPLVALVQRRSAQAAEYFRMPTRRVVVLATEIEL